MWKDKRKTKKFFDDLQKNKVDDPVPQVPPVSQMARAGLDDGPPFHGEVRQLKPEDACFEEAARQGHGIWRTGTIENPHDLLKLLRQTFPALKSSNNQEIFRKGLKKLCRDTVFSLDHLELSLAPHMFYISLEDRLRGLCFATTVGSDAFIPFFCTQRFKDSDGQRPGPVLMKYACDRLRENGVQRVFLQASLEAKLTHFYERQDFKCLTTRRPDLAQKMNATHVRDLNEPAPSDLMKPPVSPAHVPPSLRNYCFSYGDYARLMLHYKSSHEGLGEFTALRGRKGAACQVLQQFYERYVGLHNSETPEAPDSPAFDSPASESEASDGEASDGEASKERQKDENVGAAVQAGQKEFLHPGQKEVMLGHAIETMQIGKWTLKRWPQGVPEPDTDDEED